MKTSLKHKLEYSAFTALKTFSNILPRKTGFVIGSLLGNIFYLWDQKHKKLAYSNLQKSFGNKYTPQAKKSIIKASFIHFSQIFLDFLKISKLTSEQKDRLISEEGSEILKKELLKKKGALIFTAHFGLWEIAAHILSKHAKLNVIARPLDNPLLEKELFQMRTLVGSHVIYKKNATKQVLRALRRNELVAVLIDQNVLRREGISVKFFGKDASTTPSLATFFLRTKAPVIPIFCTPTSKQGYHLKIMHPPEFKSSGDFDKDVVHITQICTDIIEREIKKQPHFWLWFHDRWRSAPSTNH